ncbi:recombinase family protein [Ruminococcus sp. 210702-SL.1.03]|nr:recombinase family protein [Ruminococcus sp. 210702-SL.1.03]
MLIFLRDEVSATIRLTASSSEKISGASADRPQLKAMLDYVREGDTLYIESISHKENIDTDTPSGKFMLTVFAALSQLEREQFKQRQREGIEIAKAQGKYTGRKPIEIDWTRFGQLYGEWKSKNITGRDFMRRMGLYGTDYGCANRLRASSTHQYCALTKS